MVTERTVNLLAALLSFGTWLALLLGWLYVFGRFFEAGLAVSGQGHFSSGMFVGALWALAFYYIQAKTFDMLSWLIDVWKGDDDA